MTTDILVLKDIDHIRSRHTMYVDSVDHASKEAIDNVIDEYQAGSCNYLGVALDTKTNQMIVADNGRGIPVELKPEEGLSTLAIVFTKLHSSGKYDNRDKNKYNFTIGLNGVGIKITTATSELFEAWTRQGNKTYKLTADRGVIRRAKTEPVAGITLESFPNLPFEQDSKLTTILRYNPDPLVFGKKDYKLNPLYFKELCQNLQYLCPGLCIELVIDESREIFKNDLGIKGLLSQYQSSVVEEMVVKNQQLDLILWWDLPAENEIILSYVNCQRTSDDGKHVDGLRKAVAKAFGEKSKGLSKFLREGFRCAFHLKLDNPEFKGQTKHHLLNSEADDLMQRLLEKPLIHFFDKNTKLITDIIKRAEALQQASDAYKMDREALKALEKTRAKSLSLPDKLVVAPNCPRNKKELYICEGASAGEPIVKARRKPLYQEVYKLRGKITNAFKKDLNKVLQNEDIVGLIQSIGCDAGDKCNPQRARVGKIILCTDADADGSHINALLISLFTKYMPPIIEAGMLYVLKSPLFIANYKEFHWYGIGDNEGQAKKDLMSKIPSKFRDKVIINRFKGHGAASPEEIQEYALGEKRQIIKVNLPPGDDELVSYYMGDDVSSRKKLLEIE